MLKLYFGWRIELPNEPLAAGSLKSHSIRDILIGTLITALSITAVRFVVDSLQDLDLDFWAAWGIGVACLSGELSRACAAHDVDPACQSACRGVWICGWLCGDSGDPRHHLVDRLASRNS